MKSSRIRLLNTSRSIPAQSSKIRAVRKFTASFEPLEARELLASGFLQGTAFVDGDGNGAIDPGEALAGATIALYMQNPDLSYSHVGVDQTTQADGRYRFTDLDAGKYRIVETPPLNFANQGTQILSQLNPATALNTSTIEVTLLDPSSLTTTIDGPAILNNPSKWYGIQFTFNGATRQDAVGQFPVVVNSANPAGSAQLLTFCADLFHSFTGGVDAYGVLPAPAPPGLNTPQQNPPQQNWDRVAYLYNHYGTADLSRQDGAGLQLAIWELLYDGSQSAPDFASGNFGGVVGVPGYTSEVDLNAVLARAEFYWNDSVGKSEQAIYLDATVGGTIQSTTGRQSVIATGSLNFNNLQLGSISGVKFNDLNGDGVRQGGENGLAGWTIQLLDTGNKVLAATTTGTDGSYSFNGLRAGTYRVREVGQAGWVQQSVNPGDVAILSGTVVTTGEDFGNFQRVSITGRKVNDVDGDGYDTSDPGLGGVTIKLYQGGDATGAVIATATTASDGTYRFDGLAPGTYFVQEVVPPGGWVQTGGNDGYIVTVGGSGVTSGTTVSDQNFANYRNPLIDIEKTTTGTSDTYTSDGVPILTPGSTVTWTYQVTNTGTVPFAKSDVAIVDDNGTPGNTADDLTVANGKITFQSEQTGNGDNVLDPGEVWIYTATGTVKDLSTPGASSTFDFSGNSSTYGPAGNVRIFNAGGVSVNVSAFSRDKSSGAWSPAYLGSYGGGLGVTDGSEGYGSYNSHTVDNIGRDNYVLFEFSQNVVVDAAYLGYVVGDSDMKVWIGTKTDAFNNHMALSDAALVSLGFSEVNLTNSSSPRWADFNAGNRSGNVLVIATDPGDCTPDDQFKIQNVKLATSTIGVYENTATVTAPGAPPDSDLSHYTNPGSTTPTTPQTGSISGTKFLDVTGNGASDDDTPLANTRIYLDINNNGKFDSGEPSTTTGQDGSYTFTGLAQGTYVVREVVPTGYVRTGPALSDNYTVTLGAGEDSTGNDFTNAETCDEVLQCVSYKIIRPDGSCFTTNDLRGKVPQGSTVQVTFTIPRDASAHPYTLVSYTAPEGTFIADHASQQVIFDQATGTFQPGKTYTLSVQVPNSYFQVDFVCGLAIDQLGPAGSNIFYTPQNRLISADNGGTQAGGTGSLSGFVYVDQNNNGQIDYGEDGIKNVTLTLTGTDYLGNPVTKTATTDSNGFYKFSGLQPGAYSIAESQPANYLDGKDSVGSLGGKNLSNDVLSQIALNFAQNGTNYNFGERLTTGSPLTCGGTATIGFWNNCNGQRLINSLNGGSRSTALGNWLGTTFPNLYGNLKGKSNSYIADYFQDLFDVRGQKLEAQVLATALSVYVTDSGKAGTVARSYGFTVSNSGSGNSTINIGNAGGTLGVSNYSTQSLSQILALTDSLIGQGGALSRLSTTKRNALNTLFNTINTKGDI